MSECDQDYEVAVTDEICPNCMAVVEGSICPECGQKVEVLDK